MTILKEKVISIAKFGVQKTLQERKSAKKNPMAATKKKQLIPLIPSTSCVGSSHRPGTASSKEEFRMQSPGAQERSADHKGGDTTAKILGG